MSTEDVIPKQFEVPNQGGNKPAADTDGPKTDVDDALPKGSYHVPVGYDESYGIRTRRKKGSKRPPDIPGVIWSTLGDKGQKEAIANYERTGFGWPKEPKGTVAQMHLCTATLKGETKVIEVVPAMPVLSPLGMKQTHRTIIPDIDNHMAFMCVASSITKKEAATNPDAAKAMDKEWDKLEKQVAWELENVREWSDVVKEANAKGVKVHVGRVFGILVEKGSELPKGHPDRKFKGREVFQGNQVKDQVGDWALFEELSSAPATMEAGKAVDAYGCVEGNVCEQADGTSAYTQALLGGTKRWPKPWRAKFRNPVVPLRLALYGHPHAGGLWERHCEQHLRAGLRAHP